MLTVLVRSKRDADAFKNMLSNYREDWRMDVKTLKGARGTEIIDKIREYIDEKGFYIVMLGKEEKEIVKELSESTPPNVIVHMVPKKRLRNARLRELNWELEVAKSQPRLWIRWSENTPILSKTYVRGEPSSDSFVVWGLWWKTLNLGDPSPKALLVIKRKGGFHEVWDEGKVAATFELTDERGPDTIVLRPPKGFELTDFVERSKGLVDSFVKYSSVLFEGCERAVVPWSGGKDSTASLLFAKEYCDEVTAIYVDTGVDMGMNKYYIEKVAELLNVEVVHARAPVRERISELGFPNKEDRWCTGLKIKALENEIKRIGPDVIVVGDRDAESSSRSSRWVEREWTGVGKVVTPIKLWSAAMVEALLISRGVPLNPLYPSGFYRLGCYVCPFLRKYERDLLAEVSIARLGADLKLLEEFLDRA